MKSKEMEGQHGISHLVFNFGITQVFAHYYYKVTGNHLFVTEGDFLHKQGNIE